MPHEPRLQQSLRELLQNQRTAALAVQPVADFSNPMQLPAPALSFVPWAWCTEFSCIVIHVSGLASHTSAMQQHPAVSLMMYPRGGSFRTRPSSRFAADGTYVEGKGNPIRVAEQVDVRFLLEDMFAKIQAFAG